jgi:hypothetical protein
MPPGAPTVQPIEPMMAARPRPESRCTLPIRWAAAVDGAGRTSWSISACTCGDVPRRAASDARRRRTRPAEMARENDGSCQTSSAKRVWVSRRTSLSSSALTVADRRSPVSRAISPKHVPGPHVSRCVAELPSSAAISIASDDVQTIWFVALIENDACRAYRHRLQMRGQLGQFHAIEATKKLDPPQQVGVFAVQGDVQAFSLGPVARC